MDQHLVCHLVKRRHRVRCNCDSDVIKFTDNWLKFYVVYSVQWLDNLKIILLLFVLLNRGFHRGEVLLVADVDVVQQWALPWQERTTDLQTFSVPVFAFFLPLRGVKSRVFFHLYNKPYLSTVAEVAHYQTAYFLYKGFPCEFQLILAFFYQVFYFIRLQLHDAPNRKFTCPLTLVQVSQNAFHIGSLMFCGSTRNTLSSQIHNQLITIFIVLANNLIFLALFFRNHPFFKFKQDGVQLARSFFDVRH